MEVLGGVLDTDYMADEPLIKRHRKTQQLPTTLHMITELKAEVNPLFQTLQLDRYNAKNHEITLALK